MRPGKSKNRGLSGVKSAIKMLQYDASELGNMWPNAKGDYPLITQDGAASASLLMWWDFSDPDYVADSNGDTYAGGVSSLSPNAPFQTIYDKSGNGINGTTDGTVIWDFNDPGMNGNICAKTTGSGFIRATDPLYLLNGTFFIVYRNDEFQTGVSPFDSPRNLYHTDFPYTGSSSIGIRFENGSNANTLYLGNGTATNLVGSGITQKGDQGVSIQVWRINAATIQVRHNGVWQTTTSVPNLTTASWGGGFSLFRGFDNNSVRNWKGAVGEVFVYDGPLSDFEIDGIENELIWKWRTPKYRNTIATELSAVKTPLDLGLPCSLWLDAADTSGISMSVIPGTQKVNIWKDKSGSGNNFSTYNASGSTSADGPAYINYGFVGSVVPSKTVMVFGGTLGMSCPNNVIGKSNCTVFAVAGRVAASQQYAGIISSANNADSSPALRVDSYNMTMQGHANAAFSGSAWSGTNVICGVVDAGAPSLYLDGVLKASPSASGALGAVSTTSIGSSRIQGASQNFFSGWICEIIVYPSVLSATDRKRVEKYLRDKWLPSVSIADTSQAVGSWKESTNNVYVATQATTANKPTLTYDATTIKPGLLFDSTDELRSGAALGELVLSATTSPQVAFFFVASPSSQNAAVAFGAPTMPNSASRLFFSSSYSGNGNFIFDVGSAAEPGGGRITGIFPAYSTAPRVWSAYRNGTTLVVRRDGGVLATQTAAGNFTSTTGGFSIGKPETGLTTGTFHEFLAYRGVPSATDIAAIEKYLSAKWLTRLAPTVANLDAQDWINRVYQNGGEVSAATADAVNSFCNAIDGYNLRTLFFRLNLLCGTGINAMTVPLYRGPTRTGTQYGLSADANLGSPGFDSPTYYNETGSAGGLQGVSGKYLNTGFATNTLSVGNRHLAAYIKSSPMGLYTEFLGSESASAVGANQFVLGYQTTNDQVSFRCGSTSSIGARSSAQTVGGFWIGSSPTTTTADLFKNGAVEISGASSGGTATPDSSTIFIMALNRASGPTATDYFLGRMCAYSIGIAMNLQQAADYNTAMQAFQVALQRNV